MLDNELIRLDTLTGVKLAYCIAKNKLLIAQERKVLDEAIKPSVEFSEFEKKRIELAQSLAKKDDKGKPMIENNQFVMEDQSLFESEFEKLKEDYPSVVRQREEQIAEYNKFLEESVKIDFYKISLSDIPDSISVQQMRVIEPFIQT